MLSYLRIRDLALIDDVTLELGRGLSALTGETGAGKSILIGGLALLAGERASLDRLREGADAAIIEGVFDVADRPDVQQVLREEGWASGEDAVVVRRTLSRSGSRTTINDQLVTVRALARLGALLVDLAGQHESQRLLRAGAQLAMLDRFAGLNGLRKRVTEAFDRAGQLQQRLGQLQQDERDRAQRLDYLRFQLAEIRAADLSEQEEVDLLADRQRLRHAEELTELAAEALDLLYESDDAALSRLGRARASLRRIGSLDPASGLGEEQLGEAAFAIEEVARRLQPYREALESDPDRLAAIEERLAAIDALRRKYGDSVGEILARADAAEHEIESLAHHDEQVQELAQRLREAAGAYDDVATELSRARAEAAERLQERISTELGALGMQGARFVVQLRRHPPQETAGLPPGASRSGYERVEFLLAANPGEPARPLARVASGGELSRVMLSLKLAEVGDASPATLVFDEIDAGVGGGAVAERLAQRLAALGTAHQVLVVTHLPQIAARAGRHIRVNKLEHSGRTVIRVATLDAKERVDELARMLGGVQITQSVREHARDLLGNRD